MTEPTLSQPFDDARERDIVDPADKTQPAEGGREEAEDQESRDEEDETTDR